MHPIIFKAGPIIIYSFNLLLALGLFLGCFVVWKFGRDDQSEDKLFDSVLISFLLSLTISRLVFIVNHFDFFGIDIIKWLLFSHYPGFSFWGGFVGVFIGLAVVTKSKLLFRKYFDLFALGVSAVLVFGDLGCFLSACVVGAPANLPWAILVPGFELTRHPLVIYLFIADIILLFFVFKTYNYLKEKRKDLSEGKNGLSALFYVSLFFVVRGVSEFYKDKAIYFQGAPLFGILIILLGLLGLVVFYKKIGRSFMSDLRSVGRKSKTKILRIYDRITSIKKGKENSLFLLNDSLMEEKLSKSVIEKENSDGQLNS